MVQQISIQPVSQPKSQPKSQSKTEKSSFETALQKAADKLRPQAKDNGEKAGKAESGEKSPVEDVQPAANPQAEELLGALQGLPIVLWVPTDSAEIAAPTQAVQTNLLSGIQPLAVSSETALPAQNVPVLAAEQPAVQGQTTPQLQGSQIFAFPAAAQTENQQVVQKTAIQTAETIPASQATGVPDPIQVAASVQTTPQTVPQKQSVSVKTAQEQIPAAAAQNQNSATVVPAAVHAQVQAQESTLSNAPDKTTAGQSGDGKSGISQQSSDFAAMFIGQQSTGSPVSVKTVAHSLSTGTVSHLTEQIAKNVQAGQNQFRMELFPQDLGKISVSLKMEQGLLIVDILADSPKTQSLLASGSGEIRSLLESAVGQPVQIAQAVQDAPAYYQQEQESSQQQRQQSEQHDNQQEEQQSTQDFLTVLQQLKTQGSSL